ncbi:MAG: hypothetical protein V4618_15945 [Pseudomonadota bacterium]
MRVLWALPLLVSGQALCAQPVMPSPIADAERPPERDAGDRLPDSKAVPVGDTPGQAHRSAAAADAATTSWGMGGSFDLGDRSATRTSYRRFAADGIGTPSTDKLTVATSAARSPLTVSATYSDFRPIADTRALSARDVRVSLGLAF